MYHRSCTKGNLHCVCIRSMNYRLFRMVAPNTVLPRTGNYCRRRSIVPFPISQQFMLDGKTMPYSNLARLVAHFNIFLPKIGKTKEARPSGGGADCCS